MGDTPQFELQIQPVGDGYSVSAYGSLLDGDYNFSANSPADLRNQLDGLMDRITDRLAERAVA